MATHQSLEECFTSSAELMQVDLQSLEECYTSSTDLMKIELQKLEECYTSSTDLMQIDSLFTVMEPIKEDGMLSLQTNNITDIESGGTANNPSSSTVPMSQDTLDNSCKVASCQKNSGKSDDDILKEYGISPSQVKLFRSDVKPRKIYRSEKDFLAENRVKPCFVKVDRFSPALENHLNAEISKTYRTHYSLQYVHHLRVRARNEATTFNEKLVDIKAVYTNILNNSAHSFNYNSFNSLMSKSTAMHQPEVKLNKRLHIRKKLYCEGNRLVFVDERDLELGKIAAKNLNRCRIAFPYTENFFSMVYRNKIYEETDNETEIMQKQRVNIDSGLYIIIEKHELATFRAAVKSSQHCNVFPDLNIQASQHCNVFPDLNIQASQHCNVFPDLNIQASEHCNVFPDLNIQASEHCNVFPDLNIQASEHCNVFSDLNIQASEHSNVFSDLNIQASDQCNVFPDLNIQASEHCNVFSDLNIQASEHCNLNPEFNIQTSQFCSTFPDSNTSEHYDDVFTDSNIETSEHYNAFSNPYITPEYCDVFLNPYIETSQCCDVFLDSNIQTSQQSIVFTDWNINPPRLEETCSNLSTAALKSDGVSSSRNAVTDLSISDLSENSYLIDGSDLPFSISDVSSPLTDPLFYDEL